MALTPRVSRLAALFGKPDGREALRTAAHVYVNWLSATRNAGWLQGHVSKSPESTHAIAETVEARQYLIRSARRYEYFQALRLSERQRDLVPSDDMSVVWAADLKRP